MWLETTLLLGLRSALFLTCRRYVQGTLYSDLQELSSPSLDGTGEEIELQNSLPTPSTAPPPKAPHHSSIPNSIFALCFSESCMMFLLLMFQALDLFDAPVRLLNWRISLWTLLLVIVLVIPLCTSLLLTTGISSPMAEHRRTITPKTLLALVFVFITLILLSSVPLPATLRSASFVTAGLARLIVIGTFLLGLLSGFGAMRSCWNFLIAPERPTATDRDLDVSTSALARVREDLAKRKDDLRRRQETTVPTQSAWYKRVVPSFGEDSEHADAQEIIGLEALEYQMSVNLDELKQSRDKAKFERTLYGRMFNIGGRLFAVYCVFRTITAIFNLLFPTTRRTNGQGYNYPDLAAEITSYCLNLVSSRITFEQVLLASRQLGLVLVAFLILSSIRLVLRGVTRILRVTSRNLGASMMILFLAQLMGVYLLSTIVQLRTSFPPPPGEGENLFSTVPEFVVFGSLFDVAFVLAVIIEGAVLWGKKVFTSGGPA